jgi:hypothetical protein
MWGTLCQRPYPHLCPNVQLVGEGFEPKVATEYDLIKRYNVNPHAVHYFSNSNVNFQYIYIYIGLNLQLTLGP